MAQIALLSTAPSLTTTTSSLDRTQFGRLEGEWRALLQRTGHDAPCYRHELLRLWFDSFAGGAPIHVVLARDSVGPRAALCLVEEERRINGVPARILRGACSEYTGRFDLIARPGDDEGIDALWRYLRDHLDWDMIDLPRVPVRSQMDEEGAAFALLARAARRNDAIAGTLVTNPSTNGPAGVSRELRRCFLFYNDRYGRLLYAARLELPRLISSAKALAKRLLPEHTVAAIRQSRLQKESGRNQ